MQCSNLREYVTRGEEIYILVVVKYVFTSFSYPLKKNKTLKLLKKCSLENELSEYHSTSRLIPIDFFRDVRDYYEILDYIKEWLFLAVGFSRKFVKTERDGQDLHND